MSFLSLRPIGNEDLSRHHLLDVVMHDMQNFTHCSLTLPPPVQITGIFFLAQCFSTATKLWTGKIFPLTSSSTSCTIV